MAIDLGNNIKITAGLPVDSRYQNAEVGPYTSCSVANSLIGSGFRYQGLTVNIAGVEWWYKDGILDSHLTPKSLGGGMLNWTGSTSNAIGTYMSPSGICAQPNLTFESNGLNVTGGTTIVAGGGLVLRDSPVGTPLVVTTQLVNYANYDGKPTFLVNANYAVNQTIAFQNKSGYNKRTIFDELGNWTMRGDICTTTNIVVGGNTNTKTLTVTNPSTCSSTHKSLFIDPTGIVTSGDTPSSGIQMIGTTTNGLTTRINNNCICAQPNLTFNSSRLNINNTINFPNVDGTICVQSPSTGNAKKLVIRSSDGGGFINDIGGSGGDLCLISGKGFGTDTHTGGKGGDVYLIGSDAGFSGWGGIGVEGGGGSIGGSVNILAGSGYTGCLGSGCGGDINIRAGHECKVSESTLGFLGGDTIISGGHGGNVKLQKYEYVYNPNLTLLSTTRLETTCTGVRIYDNTNTKTLTVTNPSTCSSTHKSLFISPTGEVSSGGTTNEINGVGFVKANGTTISYDNSTYLTTAGTAYNSTRFSGLVVGEFTRTAQLGGTSTVRSLDERTVNELPSTDIQYGVKFGFKTSTAIGLNSIAGTSTYASAMTFAPYSDNSGNNNSAFRLAHSGGILAYQNYNNDVWGSWEKIATENWIGTQGFLTSASLINYTKRNVNETVSGVWTFENELKIFSNNPYYNFNSSIKGEFTDKSQLTLESEYAIIFKTSSGEVLNIVDTAVEVSGVLGVGGNINASGIIKSGGINVSLDGHTHTIANITNLQSSLNAKQNTLNGVGFVKANGTTISYDNNSYLTTTGTAYNSNRLGNVLASSYTRRDVNETITGNWQFGLNADETVLKVVGGYSDVVKLRTATIKYGRSTESYNWRVGAESTQSWFNLPDFHFRTTDGNGVLSDPKFTITYDGDVLIGTKPVATREYVDEQFGFGESFTRALSTSIDWIYINDLSTLSKYRTFIINVNATNNNLDVYLPTKAQLASKYGRSDQIKLRIINGPNSGANRFFLHLSETTINGSSRFINKGDVVDLLFLDTLDKYVVL